MEGENKQTRQACEVYSRVVGYIRPVQSWNPGKQSEFDDRRTFKVTEGEAC
jgi:ribonucleoside-triphosphate reductase